MDTIGKRLAHAIELSGMAGPTAFGFSAFSALCGLPTQM
jgi:hypothetical protein